MCVQMVEMNNNFTVQPIYLLGLKQNILTIIIIIIIMLILVTSVWSSK